MRTLSIVGARPQFIKLAPVSRAMTGLADGAVEDIILHTGQHYDAAMSQVFFDELQIPKPVRDLSVGSGSHGQQTARMLQLIEEALMQYKPDLVITYGDTNSTVAGALASAKMNIPLAHIEAGLRSFNRQMPEEINRIVTDHVSDLLFAPTATAVRNLTDENLSERTTLSGDVMLDAVIYNKSLADRKSRLLERLSLSNRQFAVATLHRPVNTDTYRLRSLLSALNDIATEHCVVLFPVHPRTVARIKSEVPEWLPAERLMLIEPIGYLDMLQAVANASVILTDSGGVQKESFFLGTPCVTLRDETEWPETMESGANVLVGDDIDRLHGEVRHRLQCPVNRAAIQEKAFAAFGRGLAAERIVQTIMKFGTASHSRAEPEHSVAPRPHGRIDSPTNKQTVHSVFSGQIDD